MNNIDFSPYSQIPLDYDKAPEVVEPAWCRKIMSLDKGDVLEPNELIPCYGFLRSTRELFHKSKYARSNESWKKIWFALNNCLAPQGFGQILDIQNLIHSLNHKCIGPGTPYLIRLKRFRVNPSGTALTENELKMERYLQAGGVLARAQAWQWRVEQAVEECIQNQWYPLFATYTVGKDFMPKGCLTRDDLWIKTDAWDKFIKLMQREVAEACGYGRKPEKWPPVSTFFQYYAVIEHGQTGLHPHCHCLFLLKDIPKLWKIDPNRDCKARIQCDIPAASGLWPYGTQKRVQGLFIVGSWFSENWVPYHKLSKDGKRSKEPIKIGNAANVAGYIGKYMMKGDTKKWNHRVKATKSLGLKKLRQTISSVQSLGFLSMMAFKPSKYKDWMAIQVKTNCPLHLVQKISRTVLVQRLISMSGPLAERYLMVHLTKRPNVFYTNLMKSVKNGRCPWRETSQQRYNWYSQIAGVPDTENLFKNFGDRYRAWLEENFPIQVGSEPFVLMKGNFK